MGCSWVVTHPDTNPARRCLTSMIWRKPVCCHRLAVDFFMFWRNLKVLQLGVSTVLAPHNISFRQAWQIRPLANSMGCITPFELLSKSALSASECRKTLLPWRQPERLGRGGPFLTGHMHSSNVNLLHVLLPSRHGCVAKCDSPASRIVDKLLTKSDYYWVFLQAIFYDVTSDPREPF